MTATLPFCPLVWWWRREGKAETILRRSSVLAMFNMIDLIYYYCDDCLYCFMTALYC